jgi:hypothetical protein
MKAQWAEEVQLYSFANLGVRWGWVVSVMPGCWEDTPFTVMKEWKLNFSLTSDVMG